MTSTTIGFHCRPRGTSLRLRGIGAVWACLVLLSPASACATTPSEGIELIGTTAPQWDVIEWINSKPLSLDELKGSVVLVRWWTGPECPYCATSAPNLNALYANYQPKGLVVLGFYHHKSPTPLTRQHVEELVKRYRFQFPVAIDPGWQTLKRWWLDGHDRRWTSVSFLIDQAGIIRYIHPGGAYTREDVQAMEATIEQLLRAPQPVGKLSQH